MKKVKFTLDNAQRSPYNALCTVVDTVIRLIMVVFTPCYNVPFTGIRRAKEQEQEQELHRELEHGKARSKEHLGKLSSEGARQL